MTKTPLILVIAVLVLGGSLYFLAGKSPVAQAQACSEILAQDTIPVPLTCAEDIGNDAGVATLTVGTDGALNVTKNGQLVFANPTAEEDLGGDFMEYDGSGLKTEGIQFVDVTYDGYKDIVFLASAGAYNWTYQYYAYDPAKGTYAPKPILEATNPDVDAEKQTITDFTKVRGLGDMYVLAVYHFENGEYMLVHRESQDMISEEGDSSKGYVLITEDRKDGKMVETSRKTLTEKEVWGEE